MTETIASIAAQIRATRTTLYPHVFADEFADQYEVDPGAYDLFEQGVVSLPTSIVRKMCFDLGLPIPDIRIDSSSTMDA